MQPGVRRRDRAGSFKILVEELISALCTKGTRDLLLDFGLIAHAVIGIRAAVSTAIRFVATARASRGGTAFPTWRYLE